MHKTSLSQRDVNTLYEIALFLEDLDPPAACGLMRVAQDNRPQGPVITRRMQQYARKGIVADDAGASSIRAARLLRADIPQLGKFLPVAGRLIRDPAMRAEFEREYGEIISIAKTLNDLSAQNEILRAKLNEIHRALCYSGAFKVRTLDDPAAKVSPVEVLDHGSPDTVLAFGGMLTRLSLPSKEFFASLIGRGANVIFVKDFQQCWYLNGLMGLTSGFDDTVEYLKGLIPAGTTNLACLGTSAGGYAAIRFGAALSARKVAAFAPQTNITQDVVARFKSVDTRTSEFDTTSDDHDLRTMLAAMSGGIPDIEIHYGKDNGADRDAAEHLGDYARLVAHDTASHSVAQYMKEQGLLDRALLSLLGDRAGA